MVCVLLSFPEWWPFHFKIFAVLIPQGRLPLSAAMQGARISREGMQQCWQKSQLEC